MAEQLQLRRGTTSENNAFTGAAGELTADTTLNQLRLHDGSTAGGHTIGGGGGGGDAMTTDPLSQFAATTSAQLRGVISDETGTGSLVFATSPTLVTPALGTPASGTLTNCTGLPVAGLATFPIVHTLEFYSTGAPAAGVGVRGILNTTDTTSALRVPSGKTLKILTATGSIKTGATAGTYTVEVALRNVTDSTYTTLASTTAAASTIAYPDAVGTYGSPLATLAGPKEFSMAYYNNGSSPGTLDATHKHHVLLTYIIE